MTKQFQEHLQLFNSINEYRTVASLIYQCLQNYHNHYSHATISEIDNWVGLAGNSVLQEKWEKRKTKRWSLYFLREAFDYYHEETVRKKEYHRLTKHSVFTKTDKPFKLMLDELTEHIISLGFIEGIHYLGELTGVWMLVCPESAISDLKSERYKPWEKAFLGEYASNFSEVDLRILLTIDSALYHYQFEYWDEEGG